MSAVLGAVAAWAVILALTLGPTALVALAVWLYWLRVQRARRAAWWARQPAYDRAYVRALEDVAVRNGARDAWRDVEELER